MNFNLFDQEEKIIAEALALKDTASGLPASFAQGLENLIDAYKKSYREQKRLVKMSDRAQEQLSNLNHELHLRKKEAEEALAKLKETQESLVQAEKMASLGGLVAGVAHEINTPVGIAVSTASFLQERTVALTKIFTEGKLKKNDFQDFLEQANESSQLILANCQRAAQLIQGFKQVAVDQTSAERRKFNLNEYLHEILVSLNPKMRQMGIKTRVICPENIEVDGFPGSFSQIITNLVMNSLIHAFDNNPENGEIIINVSENVPGQLTLIYSDNGKGIPEANRAKIFDPFFTTKRGQGGSGLGLHIVHNLVVSGLKGKLSLDMAYFPGASFILNFPVKIPVNKEM